MPEVVTLTARGGMPKAGLVTVAVLEGAAGSPPFQGEVMLVEYFGLTLLHTQKERSYV
jgi:hypothetical protein